MTTSLCHGPAGSMSQTAGVLGLEHEIRTTPTHELINQATFPAELIERRQWVAWRFMERGGKRTKTPVNPGTQTDLPAMPSYDDKGLRF